jgi:hypothetical protein
MPWVGNSGLVSSPLVGEAIVLYEVNVIKVRGQPIFSLIESEITREFYK